jgi:hypothetical protein
MRLRKRTVSIGLLGAALLCFFAAPTGAANPDPSVGLVSPGGPVTLYRENRRVTLVQRLPPTWHAVKNGRNFRRGDRDSVPELRNGARSGHALLQ